MPVPGQWTWRQRFLRRRALACVVKLAGPLGESMAWSGAAAMQGKSKRSRAEGRRYELGVDGKA